jgi:hypothetical protein
VLGAVVLAHVSAGGAADTLASHVLDGVSVATFTHVFIGVACVMAIAFIAMLVIEEKPLEATMPAARR